MSDDEQTPVTREDIGKVIWETSRADEGSISATGANIVADAILAKFTVLHPAPVTVPPTLDPEPWILETGWRSDEQAYHPTHGLSRLEPRPGYSQNPADYSPKGMK